MGLYVQREALLISQKALDITGNNISNINTPGYTRQRVDICSVANAYGTLGYNTAISMSGRGAEAVGVAQIRDRLMDKKVRTYSSDLCNVGIKTNTLSDVEDVFDSIEADEKNASFASIVSTFKAALQGFSVDHADRSELANISKNTAGSIVQCVVNYNTKLNDISDQVLEDTKKTVDRINSMLSEMGRLNKQIKESYISMNYITSSTGNYEVMGNYGPLELKDKMNSLLDELSQYGNIDFAEEADGTFTVTFADRRVVEEEYYAQMALTKEDPKPTELEFVVSKNLMKYDDWYKLNVKYGTGGNADLLVRTFNSDPEIGGTVNISDLNTDGIYKLDSGSLRGYLDVYNGRGIYANSLGAAQTNVTKANDALKELSALNEKVLGGTALTDEEKARADELTTLLKDTIGADVTVNPDGTYRADLNGTGILVAKDAANITLGSTVSVDGTPDANITSDDIGGARGAETINDALENIAKINKQIAEINAKLNTTPPPSDSDRAAYMKQREDAYVDAQRFVGILKDGKITVTDSNNSNGDLIGVSLKGTDLLKGADLDTAVKLSVSENNEATMPGQAAQKITLGGAAADYLANDAGYITNSYQGIEYFRDMLNAFVKTMTEEMNGIFSDPAFNNGKGWKLFTYENGEGELDFRTAAENFRIADDWNKNPEIISNPTGNNKFEELDNVYINKMLGVLANEQTYGDGTIHDKLTFSLEKYVSHICDDLGDKLAEEKIIYSATDVMLTEVEKDRSEIMDVSMDEEGINMMNYQKWYNAIARMISTMDEALDKLINGTGIVGLR